MLQYRDRANALSCPKPLTSVAKAKAAKVSIIRLTQSSWTARSGDSRRAQAPMKAAKIATTFTVNWNTRNLEMLS